MTEEPSSSDADPEHTATELDRTDLYRLLQRQRRRHLVAHLLDVGPQGTTVEEAAAALSEASSVEAPERRVAVTLVHAHLPKLDDAGVVDYDRASGHVAPTPRLRALEPHLEEWERPCSASR